MTNDGSLEENSFISFLCSSVCSSNLYLKNDPDIVSIKENIEGSSREVFKLTCRPLVRDVIMSKDFMDLASATDEHVGIWKPKEEAG